MVARVICGKNIRGIIAYNEAKVQEEKAELIHASKFGVDTPNVSMAQKVNRFERLLSMNKKVRTNAVHISLNFDPKEDLEKEVLVRIAESYMEKIGFGNQPYLLYKHFDAGHPHLHIVTTNIQSSGQRIDLHNIGRIKSEPARKEVEIEFGLVKAEGKSEKIRQEIPKAIERAVYGKAETRRTISNIVREVTRTYRFTSLPELNAALKHFNIIADRGFEGTAMFHKKGLAYSIIDKSGRKIGIQIKASRLSGKPTLKFLEGQFRVNKVLRSKEIADIRNRIGAVLDSGPRDVKAFSSQLALQRIDLIVRENKEGRLYGLTYVDHASRCVLNGSDMGKRFTPNGVFETFEGKRKIKPSLKIKKTKAYHEQKSIPAASRDETSTHQLPQWLINLANAEQMQAGNPTVGYNKRKRRKKKGHKL